MRCGCPQCGTYMIQSEGSELGCVCPDCLYRCKACLGTNTVISREQMLSMKKMANDIRDSSKKEG
ncbi:MAG: hypothetical protein IJO93_00925 [Clostridia bacterium]|nr:hypothetical protein [Clostridia bacterium]